jgi:hypothetical protein
MKIMEIGNILVDYFSGYNKVIGVEIIFEDESKRTYTKESLEENIKSGDLEVSDTVDLTELSRLLSREALTLALSRSIKNTSSKYPLAFKVHENMPVTKLAENELQSYMTDFKDVEFNK